MKKLLLLLSLLTTNVFAQFVVPVCTTDVYLQSEPIDLYTHIEYNSQGRKILYISGCCGVFGPDHLRLTCNDTTGVTRTPNGAFLHIPDYYEFVLINPCTGDEIGEGYKEDFYLESQGDQFPWANVNGQAVLSASPVEWARITQYGYPSQNLAFMGYVQNVDPYNDCATGVSAGRYDCYNANSFDITDVPDGTYYLKVSINLPATVYDPGVYPNSYTRLCKITGGNFSWTDQLPPGGIPSNPSGLTAAMVQGSNKNVVLDWNQDASATEWIVQKYVYKGSNAGSPSGAPYRADHHPYIITPGKGQWYFGITAVGCSGNSTEVWTPSVHPTK